MNIIYSKVKPPGRQHGYFPVDLTEETMEEHFRKVMEKMREQDLDALVSMGIGSMEPTSRILQALSRDSRRRF